MTDLLEGKGFSVTGLSDDIPGWASPTSAQIMDHVENLCRDRQPGDEVIFTYSGHGTQVWDKNSEERDKKDEAIVSSGIEVITDDMLKTVFSKLPHGVKAVAVIDACHSGTLFDGKNVVVSGNKVDDATVYGSIKSSTGSANIGEKYLASRFLDPKDIAGILSEKYGKTVQPNLQSIREAHGERDHGKAWSFGGTMTENVCALVSGCQANEFSYETMINGTRNGFLTWAFNEEVRANPDVTFVDLILKIRKTLSDEGTEQNPCLECAEAMSHWKVFS